MNNMKKQGKKMIQTNLHSILIESSDSMGEEMSEKEFKIYIIKMIHEAKDEIKEQRQAMNDHSNKQMKEQLQEDHFNKEIQILKKNKNKNKKIHQKTNRNT